MKDHEMTSPRKIKVTQVKGLRGALSDHKACVRGLGLRRIRHDRQTFVNGIADVG